MFSIVAPPSGVELSILEADLFVIYTLHAWVRGGLDVLGIAHDNARVATISIACQSSGQSSG